MSIFSDNIRYLRSKLGISQHTVADCISITRGRYAKYEDDANQPPIEILIKLSKYYRISIDLMVTVDLRKYPLDDIINLPDNRIVLPIKVDSTGENKIEIIPHKAKMGYLSGYSDPEYIESLQHISLPFLRNGKFRAFPAEGDSMPPYNDETYFVGKYIEKLQDMKVNKTYLLVTRSGFSYKRLNAINEATLTVKSNESFYKPYEIPFYELLEIWEFACSISTIELEFLEPNQK